VRIKADENIGRSGIDFLRHQGHDVETVLQQGLGGAVDEAVFQACKVEARTLITLDRDFGHVLRFPPGQTSGIVILELGAPASVRILLDRLREFLTLAATRSVEGELWIVEPGRVRVHLEPDRE